MRSMLWVASTIVAAAALLLVAGCGSEGGGSGADSGGGEEAAPVTSSPAEGGGDSGESGIRGDTVEVYMTEYDFDLPGTIPAGRVVFEVHNVGFEVHNFEIPVNDSTVYTFDPPVNPDRTQYLEAVLEPGEYQVICTFSDHEGRGMITTVTAVERP